MKTQIKYLVGALLISSASLFAQQASIDSPHNYKRPVFQQKQALKKSNSPSISPKNTQTNQNSLVSVHNYKHQGVVDFSSQSSIVLGASITNPFNLNPLLSSNHYKGHAQHTNINKQYWYENNNEKQALMREDGKKQEDSIEINK